MSGMDDLRVCRDTLAEIRRRTRMLEDMREVGKRPGVRQAIQREEAALREARRAYLGALSRSVEAMAGMPEGPRSVLWQAYVLGKSNMQIAESLSYARRSVVRLKREGTAMLEAARDEA